jgi:hypothetical protein
MEEALKRAHKAAAKAAGRLSLMLETRKAKPPQIIEVVEQLKFVTNELEGLLGGLKKDV